MMFKNIFYFPKFYFVIKQSIIFFIPIFFFNIFNKPYYGFLFSFIFSCCNNSLLDIPNNFFFYKIIISAIIFSFTSMVIIFFLKYNIPLFIIFVFIFFIFGLFSEINPLYSDLFCGVIFSSIFVINLINKVYFIYIPIIYFIGTILYGLINLLFIFYFRYQSIRENLSFLYIELSLLFEKKFVNIVDYDNLNSYENSLSLSYQKVIDLIIKCNDQIYMLSNLDLNNYSLVNFFKISVNIYENISVNVYSIKETKKILSNNNYYISLINNFNLLIINRMKEISNLILYRKENFISMFLIKKIKYLNLNKKVNLVNFYIKHINVIISILINNKPLNKKNFYYNINCIDSKITFLNKIKNFCSLYSINFYISIKYSFIFFFSIFILKILGLTKPYWLIITSIIVTQNEFFINLNKIISRLLCTFIGVFLSFFLFKIKIYKIYILLIIFLLTLLGYLNLKDKYIFSTMFFTLINILNLKLLNFNFTKILVLRLFDTISGCIVSICIGLLFIILKKWNVNFLLYNFILWLSVCNITLDKILSNKYCYSEKLENKKILIYYFYSKLFKMYIFLLSNSKLYKLNLNNVKLFIFYSRYIMEYINILVELKKKKKIDIFYKKYILIFKKKIKICKNKLLLNKNFFKKIDIINDIEFNNDNFFLNKKYYIKYNINKILFYLDKILELCN